MAWDLASASVLKLVLNRLVRTRLPGGVGGAPGNRAPIPIHCSAVTASAVHLPSGSTSDILGPCNPPVFGKHHEGHEEHEGVRERIV